MDLSETIIAAMIGATATVATATFQLFMAFRRARQIRSRSAAAASARRWRCSAWCSARRWPDLPTPSCGWSASAKTPGPWSSGFPIGCRRSRTVSSRSTATATMPRTPRSWPWPARPYPCARKPWSTSRRAVRTRPRMPMIQSAVMRRLPTARRCAQVFPRRRACSTFNSLRARMALARVGTEPRLGRAGHRRRTLRRLDLRGRAGR